MMFDRRLNVQCPSCGVKMERSELTSNVFLIHAPADTKEVLRSLRCPLFGASQSLTVPEDDLLDIPSIWRTTGHFNAMWDRSK